MGALSADVAAIIRELPAKVAALEAAVKTKVEGAATAVENANIPDVVAKWETELQAKLLSAQTELQNWATKAQSLMTQLQALNLPSRIQAIETEIAALKGINISGPAKAAPQGTAAQQTPPPATQAAPATPEVGASAKPTT